jgi:UDP-N-acetylglucosamine 2-epimerase (non-hydrolysing)
VRKPVFGLLGDLPNVYLIAPLEYYSFVALMDRCRLILTDSGGIQEEAPSLEKPVLIMRETTERTEAVDLGMAKLVGTDVIGIVESADAFLSQGLRAPVAEPYNPYGDGRAAERIIAYCEHWLMKREVGS